MTNPGVGRVGFFWPSRFRGSGGEGTYKVGPYLVVNEVITWVVPPPSKSHHQDYYIFSRESL